MKRLIQRYATVGLAASEEAGRALWGAQWSRDPRWRILYYGIDLVPFQSNLNKSDVRMEFEIPKDTYVIGNVGRFDHQKNHMHALRVFKALVSRMSNVRLLLVGDGPLREDIEREITRLGLDNYVLFTGVRGDVPRLLLGGIDLMLFPSFYEGLPVAVLEAQAAGVPVVLSDAITREVEVVPKLMTWVPLSDSLSKWSDACVATLRRRRDTPCEDAWRHLASGKFDITTNVKLLESIYLDSSGL
jgi:glycosyltransferase involved in cell wall biosynthesis